LRNDFAFCSARTPDRPWFFRTTHAGAAAQASILLPPQTKPTFPRWPADTAIGKVAYPPFDGICNGDSAGTAPAASGTGS